jgi:MFS family permease
MSHVVIGTFSGRAFDARYLWPVVVAGMIVQLVGVFAMSLATNYWQLLLSHGVCTGIGGGIFFILMISVVLTYIAKRRGLAIGLVTTGNSIGSIVYPTMVCQLLSQVGFGWSVRVLGFINAAAFCTVLVFMKPRLPPRRSGPLLDPNTFRDKSYLLHVLGVTFLMPPVYFVYYYVRLCSRLASCFCHP